MQRRPRTATTASDEDQRGPHQRLHDRERPPADLVLDLGAEQREPGQVGDAGEEAHEDDQQQRDPQRAASASSDHDAGADDATGRRAAAGTGRGRCCGPSAMPQAEADEDGAEQQRRSAASPPPRPAANAWPVAMTAPPAAKAPVMPIDQAADQRGVPGERRARRAASRRTPWLGAAPARPAAAADRGQDPDDERGDQERQRVEVQREVDLVDAGDRRCRRAPVEHGRARANTIAASTGVSPYVVTRESWLAGSSWSLRQHVRDGGLLGRDPEQADASIRNGATNSQIRLSTIGIDANSANRLTSATTIVLRRSNRSAKAPASGPSTIAGSSRKSSTPPSAKLAAAKPLASSSPAR